MSKEISGIITWLKGWFFDKDDIISKEQALQTQINNKASVADLNTTNGNVSSLQSAMDNKVDKVTGKGLSTNDYTTTEKNKLAGIATGATKTVVDSALSSTSTNPLQNKVIYDIFEGTASADEVSYAMELIDGLSDSDVEFTNSNRLANEWGGITVTNLKQFSNFILDQLLTLKNIEVVKIVSTKPTASASTMNKLYVVSENNKVNVYYTEQDGTSYSWHKMDADILDELSISWSDIKNKPSTFTPTSHYHGQISVGGTIGTEANKPLITQAGGVITVGQFGDSANTFCQGNDSRLSDARTPTSHASSATTYGVGTTGGYGHNKVINDLTHNSFTNGESLSAYQGYVLNQAIESKQDKGDYVTSITLVPKGSDPTADAYNGVIRLYYGDEPSS